MKTTHIYTLTDPENQQVRYVGKANNVSQRYRAHLNRARKHQTHKKNWIESLRKKGLKPILEVIDIVPVDEWIFWETYWIAQMRTWGFNLVNYTDGGDGCTFGNKTSFSKGNKPWNYGTIVERICIQCNSSFKPFYNGSNQKYCSYSCAAKNRNPVTQFKKNNIPWNKGATGYRLGGKKKARPVLQFTLDNIFIKEFNCMSSAAKEMGCTPGNIRRACVGRSKTAKNFKWKYKNES